MSLSRLRTFIEVYRQRSISAAARSLELTQPAVSQHIAALEATLGRRLFVRESQGVTPTAAADELAADVGDKLDAAEAALASAQARSQAVAGTLQLIGHVDFLADVVAAQLVHLLEAGVRVRMRPGDREVIEQRLIAGDCELGISASASTDSRLRCEAIRAERAVAVASPAVAARIRAAADLKAGLIAQPLLAYSLDLTLIDQWLATNGMELLPISPALIGQDLRSLRSVARSGYGWTVLPDYMCRDSLARGELVEIPAPVGATSINYYLVWTPIALRQPRVAYALQTLLWRLAARQLDDVDLV